MNNFTDKICYITGAGSGMGLQAAQKLAAQGAHLVIFDLNPSAETHRSIEAQRRSPSQRVSCYQMNVADREQTLKVVAQAAAECGPPDVVINMAGIGGVAEFVSMPFAMFERMMQVNVYGSRNICEAVVPLMRDKAGARKGHIALVGSMGGIVPVYGYTAYGTSKFAVVGFAQCLRYEMKPLGIEVSCFCPGEVATPGLAAEKQATHPATAALKKPGGTISMDHAVDGLLAGIAKGRFMIVPGWKTMVTHWALRLTPTSVWNALTDLIVRRALNAKP